MTDAAGGVNFNLDMVGAAERIGWPVVSPDDAWLCLDRNSNGTIDNGAELFGDMTYQYDSSYRNGYRALGFYDLIENGGNEDLKISFEDSIYDNLRLWRDSNHDGVSQSTGLHKLNTLNVASISLRYVSSPYGDGNGNWFRYLCIAKLNNGNVVPTTDVWVAEP